MLNTANPRLRRLSFRAWRRGFREADLILGPFVDRYAPDMSSAQLDALEALMDYPDQDLYEWIVERAALPAEIDSEIMFMIRKFRDEAYVTRDGPHGG